MSTKPLFARLKFSTSPLSTGDYWGASHYLRLGVNSRLKAVVGSIEPVEGRRGWYQGTCLLTASRMDPRPSFKRCRDDLAEHVRTGIWLIGDQAQAERMVRTVDRMEQVKQGLIAQVTPTTKASVDKIAKSLGRQLELARAKVADAAPAIMSAEIKKAKGWQQCPFSPDNTGSEELPGWVRYAEGRGRDKIKRTVWAWAGDGGEVVLNANDNHTPLVKCTDGEAAFRLASAWLEAVERGLL